MAKLIKTYENDEIKNELFFNGEKFSYSMIPDECGKCGNDKCFEDQLEEKYGNENEILKAASRLDFGDEDEIERALSILSEYE